MKFFHVHTVEVSLMMVVPDRNLRPP